MGNPFKGAGIVYFFEINATTGVVKNGGVDIGEVSEFSIGTDIQRVEKFSKRDCNNTRIADLETQTSMSLTMTMDEVTATNLQFLMRAANSSVSAAAQTDEVLNEGTTIVAGDYLQTKYPFGSITSLKDSATPTANTLVLNTDYEITSAQHGIIKMLSVSGDTQPYKATYTNTLHTSSAILTSSAKYYQVCLAGTNCATNEYVNVTLWKVRSFPASQIDLLSDDFFGGQVVMPILPDTTQTAAAPLGQYGRIYTIS